MSSYSGPLDRKDGNLFMTVQRRRNRVSIHVSGRHKGASLSQFLYDMALVSPTVTAGYVDF